MDAQTLVGQQVAYMVDGEAVFFGVAEYVVGGWVGIRQDDGRLDEAPAAFVLLNN